MSINLSKYTDKLFFKQWIIGIFSGNIKDVIRSKTFDPEIHWQHVKSLKKFYADPFLILSEDEHYKILLEEFTYKDLYGKLSLMTLDKNFKQVDYKVVIDLKSHLSYPFIFIDGNKTYVFPETRKSGKLSCYEYDPVNGSLSYVQDILDLPLLDSSILKYDNKYWIFGTLFENGNIYKLVVFFSDNLMGPYSPHPCNPIRSGLNGIRSAGNFIEVDGVIYRPTQNYKDRYGDSITINKIVELSNISVVEEPHMNICINRKNIYNNGVHSIHTINVLNNIVVVDGEQWTLAPLYQLKEFYRNNIQGKTKYFWQIK